jgi:hypothetical protein
LDFDLDPDLDLDLEVDSRLPYNHECGKQEGRGWIRARLQGPAGGKAPLARTPATWLART